ncbi:hypothetical protein TNCV_2664041 [Trichonephila clavipes]|nr:hypothetical protein TNCV_2664041 [Trichonephila clavipes]
MYGTTCADMQIDVMRECLSSIKHVVGSSELLIASFHDFGDNFKLQEQLSGVSVVVVHEEPHPRDDRYIVLQARRNRLQARRNRREKSLTHTTQETGRPISRFTVARRLHGGGLFARRPVRCLPLTPAHSVKAFSVVPGTPELERQ